MRFEELNLNTSLTKAIKELNYSSPTSIQEKAIPKNLQYFNKPAGVGKPTPPHQDGYYFMLKKHNAVTCWLALEKVDEENGCGGEVYNMEQRVKAKAYDYGCGYTVHCETYKEEVPEGNSGE